MIHERWSEICDQFSELVDLDSANRHGRLEKLKTDDPTLHAEVLTLLQHHDSASAEQFLDAPPWALDRIPLGLPDFGDYSRIEYVGHGGMGVVYRAEQNSLRRTVALKMSLPHGLNSAADEQRFFAEAESMAKLQHANIIRVHEVSRVDGRPYFSMDLIEGTTLAETVTSTGDLRRRVGIVRDIAGAVHHAHMRGILHRDLKPENILLDAAGLPWITDFGLAKPVTQDEGGGQPDPARRAIEGVQGTAAYMSPEQADPTADETVLSDVYGLGAILYFVLTGRPPHQPADPRETLRLARRGRPTSARALNAQLDADIDGVCMRALSAAPEDRYHSAEEMVADLDHWLANQQTSARPWSTRERMTAWRRNNAGVAWLGAVALVLLVLAAALVAGEVLETLRQPGEAQAALARHQADTVRLRLMQLVGAVDAAAETTDFAGALASGDLESLQRQLLRVGADRIDLDGAAPFESWFVIDVDGRMVARWPERTAGHIGLDFRVRDYFQGALACGRDPASRCACRGPTASSCSYVSKVFFGTTGREFKFGISRALVQQDEIIGIVVATITASPALGVPPVPGRDAATTLISRVDRSKLQNREEPVADYVMLVHPAYAAGVEPLTHPANWPGAPGEGIDEAYRDPAAAIDARFSGTWLAAFVPVAGTDFVVGAQRRSPDGSDRGD